MEAFSDAVFAVALTLLIIDISTIGLPKLDAVGLADWQQHWWPDFWPKALAFVYSFAVVAVYWVVHHNEMDLIEGTTREFNWLNLIFLLFIVVIPFSAALLGNNWSLTATIDPDRLCYSFWYKRIPMLTYSANLILAGISLQAAWLYAKRQKNREWQVNIFSDRATPDVIKSTFARNWIIPVATVPVLLVALLWSVNVGQGLLVFIPLSYAAWTLWTAHQIHKRHEREHASRIAPAPEAKQSRAQRALDRISRALFGAGRDSNQAAMSFRRLLWVCVAIAILALALWSPVWADACG